MKRYYGLAVILILLDQLTKWVVVQTMTIGQSIEVIPNLLYWTSYRNKGAAWGMLEGQMVFFFIITILVVAGLVYSVCRNYLTRVRGNRRTGRKIFMQGGVCYNRSVPPAMALLCGAPIVVPPDPGLMGAFGAALETLRKIGEGDATSLGDTSTLLDPGVVEEIIRGAKVVVKR